MTIIRNGVGLQLEGRRRGSRPTYTLSGEFTTRPLAPGLPLVSVAVGEYISIKSGCVVPLDANLGFGGIVHELGEGPQGNIVVSLATRGGVLKRVEGLTDRSAGARVYVLPGSQKLSLSGNGCLIGEIAHIENLDRGTALVNFKVVSDDRPFRSGNFREVE